jgi:membrane protease YdiL (CAAX protease family)
MKWPRPPESIAHRIEPEMPDTLPTVSPIAVFVLMLMIMSIIGAWIGMILRFAFGLRVLPPNTPRVVPWGAGSVLLAILVYVGIQTAGGNRADFKPTEIMTRSAIQNAVVLVLVPLTLTMVCGARPRDLGLVAEGLDKQVFRGVVAYPLLAPFVFGAMILSVLYWGKTNHPLEEAIMADKSPRMVAILVLAGVVLAPAAEELMFRGVLLGWLTRLALGGSKPVARKDVSSLGDSNLDLIAPEIRAAALAPADLDKDLQNPYAAPTSPMVTSFETDLVNSSSRVFPLFLANVVVSLIFASLHGAVWPTPIPIFFLSLGLGVLYQRTGSIVSSTVLHMTFNGVSTLLMLLTISSPATKESPKPAGPDRAAKAAMISESVSFLKRPH